MPFIDRDFINDLSQRVDIIDLINRRVPLKKAGKDYKACCPFHNEKTPSFSVTPDKQVYYCFGCAEGGNAIDFVMKFDHLDFTEAVETVASESGISVVYNQKAKPIDPRLERYRDLIQTVSEFYIGQFSSSPAKQKAVDYAKNRGISAEIAERFEIGFAPPSNDDLLLNFQKNQQNTADLKVLGLLKTGEYGDYDFFRDRLMFPIHNTKGRVIAFGGRAFDNKAKAKYLNSSESPIFSKSKELYGLYQARKYSRSMDYILVVEGYMDVVALHQGGITRTVATLGTATTAQHLQILARTSNNIIFCFDGDAAGLAAAWKALQIALPIITAGLVIKFLFLPDGEDPDTLLKKESNKAFKRRIEKAHTLSKFLFEHVKSEVEFDTIEGKTWFLEKVLALIAQVNYKIYQQQLIQGAAQAVGQNIDKVSAIFAQQAIQSKQTTFDAPMMDELPPTPDFSDFPQDYHTTPTVQNNAIKVLMSKMISLLLNYPTLANGKVESRVKNIENSKVLLELVHSAQIDEDISQQDLIKPFSVKPTVYSRLQQLCTLQLRLSETQAREEFIAALNAAEKHQENAKITASITSASSTEEQQRIMEGIKKGKI